MTIRQLQLQGFRFAVLMVAALTVTPKAFSQAIPSNPPTWDLFGGGSYNESFNPSQHDYGWDASVSERPYISHPWVGGTVEAGGAYTSASATAAESQLYTVMAGPSFVLRGPRIQPFARALLGATIQRTQTPAGASNAEHFGLALGGGVDIPFSRSWAIRGQADWVRSYTTATYTSDMLRASVGLVVRW
jgi:opacity protein-like surface antigen